MYWLRDRVRLAWGFGRLCDTVVALSVDYCANCRVVGEDVMVPERIEVLGPV